MFDRRDDSLDQYLNQIGKSPLLNRAEEEELVQKLRNGDEEAGVELIQRNLRLVVHVAKEFITSRLPFCDLISAGNIGLAEAVKRHNPATGGKLSDYAPYWIKLYIREEIAAQGEGMNLSEYVLKKIEQIRSVEFQLQGDLGRKPTGEELAHELGMNRKRLAHYRMIARAPLSLDAPAGDAGKRTNLESIGDRMDIDVEEDEELQIEDSPLELLMSKDLHARLLPAVEKLPERLRRIIIARFGLDGHPPRTLEEVGQELGGYTKEYIRQLQNQALQLLQSMLDPNLTPQTESAIVGKKTLRKIVAHESLNEPLEENPLGAEWGISGNCAIPTLALPAKIDTEESMLLHMQSFVRALFDSRCRDMLQRLVAGNYSTTTTLLSRIPLQHCAIGKGGRSGTLEDIFEHLVAYSRGISLRSVTDAMLREYARVWLDSMQFFTAHIREQSRRRTSRDDTTDLRVLPREPEHAQFLLGKIRSMYPSVVGPSDLLINALLDYLRSQDQDMGMVFFYARYFFAGSRQPSQDFLFEKMCNKGYDFDELRSVEIRLLHRLGLELTDLRATQARTGGTSNHFSYTYPEDACRIFCMLRGAQGVTPVQKLGELHLAMDTYPIDIIAQLAIQTGLLTPEQCICALSGQASEGLAPHTPLQIAMMLGVSVDEVETHCMRL